MSGHSAAMKMMVDALSIQGWVRSPGTRARFVDPGDAMGRVSRRAKTTIPAMLTLISSILTAPTVKLEGRVNPSWNTMMPMVTKHAAMASGLRVARDLRVVHHAAAYNPEMASGTAKIAQVEKENGMYPKRSIWTGAIILAGARSMAANAKDQLNSDLRARMLHEG